MAEQIDIYGNVPQKKNLWEGVDKAIEVLVSKATTERFPDGEPEPKLFSEGYRKALTDYSRVKAARAIHSFLGGVRDRLQGGR